MKKYKESFYNIHLKEEGYLEGSDIPDNLVYNTMSGKFGTLSDIDFDNPPKHLVYNRFLVNSDLDEVESYSTRQQKLMLEDKPKRIELNILTTLNCSYRCEYCIEPCDKDTDISNDMIKSYIEYIRNEIDRNENLKTLTIQWFGGEPLLRMDVIREISQFVIPYCQKRNIKYNAYIFTNGYLYSKSISEELREYRVKYVQITLDGYEDTYNRFKHPPKDAYARVFQNIEDSVIPVVVRLHATRKNTDEIISFSKYLSETPWIIEKIKKKTLCIFINRVLEHSNNLKYGFTDTEWLEFRERAIDTAFSEHIRNSFLHQTFKSHTYSCPFLQSRNVMLCPDGNLYRCDRYFGLKEHSVGTIKEGVDFDCNANKAFVSSTIDEDCKKCKLLPVCGGDYCRYEFIHNGKKCALVKGEFKQNLKVFTENHLKNKRKQTHGSLLPPKGK